MNNKKVWVLITEDEKDKAFLNKEQAIQEGCAYIIKKCKEWNENPNQLLKTFKEYKNIYQMCHLTSIDLY